MSRRITIEQLGVLLKEKRGGGTVRDVAATIGISAATLSRVESGKQPDLDTFSKICSWLALDAGKVLGIAQPHSTLTPSQMTGVKVESHFRADKTLGIETAQHLGALILSVHQTLEDERAKCD